MSRNAFSSIERALNESQALREHAAMERPMFNFHSHHQFHDDKPEERADRFTPKPRATNVKPSLSRRIGSARKI